MSAAERGIAAILANRIGLDPRAIGDRLISSAVARRMLDARLTDPALYERLLGESERELQSLIDDVIVPESWFCRDERPFEWLREIIRTGWLIDPRPRPLRILSLGCAAGEEPYSAAMLALEHGLSPRRIEIDAVDVSERGLKLANEAVYGPHSFRGGNAALGFKYRDRFFHPHPQGFVLDARVRTLVRFIHSSIIDPRLLEGRAHYDILLCRNVFIYLDADARTRVLATIDRLLAPDGALVIGHADRLDSAAFESRFKPSGYPGCFVHLEPPLAGAQANTRPKESRRTSAMRPSPTERSTDVAISPKAIAPTTQGHADSPERAADLANQGKCHEAIAVCERYIRRNGPTAAAYFLMGMIRQSAGERSLAEECFKKAVYLDPSHADALLALALLAEREGDFGQAAGYRRRIERIMASTPTRTV